MKCHPRAVILYPIYSIKRLAHRPITVTSCSIERGLSNQPVAPDAQRCGQPWPQVPGAPSWISSAAFATAIVRRTSMTTSHESDTNRGQASDDVSITAAHSYVNLLAALVMRGLGAQLLSPPRGEPRSYVCSVPLLVLTAPRNREIPPSGKHRLIPSPRLNSHGKTQQKN